MSMRSPAVPGTNHAKMSIFGGKEPKIKDFGNVKYDNYLCRKTVIAGNIEN